MISTVKKIRRRPELVFIPTFLIWFAINLPPWSIFGGKSLAVFGLQTGLLLGPTFTYPQNLIFPLTYLMAWVSLVSALVFSRKNLGLNWIRSIFLSLSFPFAFVGFFEEIWQNLWIFRGIPPALSNEVWMLSWVILGFSSVIYWKPKIKSWVTLGALIISFSIWLSIGYPQLGGGDIKVIVLNWITKILTFLLFFFLFYDGSNVNNHMQIKKNIVAIDKSLPTDHEVGHIFDDHNLKNGNANSTRTTKSNKNPILVIFSIRKAEGKSSSQEKFRKNID